MVSNDSLSFGVGGANDLLREHLPKGLHLSVTGHEVPHEVGKDSS